MQKIIIFFTSIRLIQWSKNLLIFVPLLISGAIDFQIFNQSLFGFISFSLISSAGYLTNDIIDRDTDKKHPLKSKRPIAALDIPIKYWIILIAILVISSDLLAYFFINKLFLIIVNVYFLLSLIYTLIIKKISFVDLIFLSSLYTIRLIAGCIAINIIISNWLFIFSIFFFLSLASNKRIIELNFFKKNNSNFLKYKSYSINFINILNYISLLSTVLSLATLTVYFMSSSTAAIFSDNLFLVNIVYIVIVSLILIRFNILSHIDKNSDNQIEIYLKDLISVTFCLIMLIMILLENSHVNIIFN